METKEEQGDEEYENVMGELRVTDGETKRSMSTKPVNPHNPHIIPNITAKYQKSAKKRQAKH